MKKIIFLILTFLILLSMVACNGGGEAMSDTTGLSDVGGSDVSGDTTGSSDIKDTAGSGGADTSKPEDDSTNTSGTTGSGGNDISKPEDDGIGTIKETHKATIVIENYGTIELALCGEVAPITVANFEKLANSGFYDGLTFHRIMEGFMMQGGDPNGNGTGGSDTEIKGEFKNNGVNNPISHKRGVISMARAGHPYYDHYYYDTGSCQFFIMHVDNEYLDGNYAAFGYVVSGIEVVDAICTSAKPTDDNGTIPKAEQPKIISIRVEAK